MSQLQLQDFSALYAALSGGDLAGEGLTATLKELVAVARARRMEPEALLVSLERAGITLTDAATQWLSQNFTQEA